MIPMAIADIITLFFILASYFVSHDTHRKWSYRYTIISTNFHPPNTHNPKGKIIHHSPPSFSSKNMLITRLLFRFRSLGICHMCIEALNNYRLLSLSLNSHRDRYQIPWYNPRTVRALACGGLVLILLAYMLLAVPHVYTFFALGSKICNEP